MYTTIGPAQFLLGWNSLFVDSCNGDLDEERWILVFLWGPQYHLLAPVRVASARDVECGIGAD